MRLEQPGGGRPIEFELRGDWMSAVSAVRSGEYDVELELTNARISGLVSGNAPQGSSEQLSQRLERPFWVTYRDDGALLSVHFFKDVDPGNRNLFQMIATEMQFVETGAERPAWTILEHDAAGEYLAMYNRQDPNTIMKRKVKYVRTDGAVGAPAGGVQIEIDHSEALFSMDAGGGILSADILNRVRIGVAAQGAGQVTATTETHLSNFRASATPERIGSLSRALAVETSAVVTHAADPVELRKRLDSQLLEGHTAESLLQAAMGKSDDKMLTARLAALFRQRPDAVASALAQLRSNGPRKQLVGALGSAGSPAAVEALAAIARDRKLSAALREDALVAFMFIESPSPEAMRVPLDLLDEENTQIASVARLAGGALARAGRAAHPGDARTIDGALLSRFQKAQTVGEATGLLAAMGNSAGASVLPAIEDCLRDSRAPLRAAAARALRLAPGAAIDALRARTIVEDPDAEVRNAAIQTAGFRHPLPAQIGQALVRAAKTDPDETVRSSAVTLLRLNPAAAPDVAGTLEWVAEHDSKDGMRRLAREALASIR